MLRFLHAQRDLSGEIAHIARFAKMGVLLHMIGVLVFLRVFIVT